MPAPSLRDIIQCAQTGVRSHDMTLFDVLRARQMQGGSIPESTIVGVPPISFVADGTPLSAWIVLGNIDLDIAPSPDNIIVPQEFGDKTANLLNINATNILNGYVANSYLRASGDIAPYDPAANSWNISEYIKVEPNTTYCFADGISHISPAVCEYDNQLSYISGKSFGNTDTIVITTSANTTYLRVSIYSDTLRDVKPMLNLGSAALPYEPYGVKIPIALGTTYPIYLSAPIRAMGEHADAAASTGVVTRRVRKITFDGTESGWALFSGNGAYQFYIGNALSSALAVSGSSALSNIAPYGATAATRAEYQYGCYPISSGQGIAFQMYGSASAFPDVPAWKAFIAQMSANGTPVAAWYVLAEPQEEAFEAPILTPTAGTNTLSVDTTLQPTSVSITGHIRQT